MPYTPPSQQSPASTRTSSPTLSRNPSISHELPSRSSNAQRPNLPRSISSTAYLNKHRRSPSVTSPTTVSSFSVARSGPATKDAELLPALNTALRQSPPPVNDLKIPTGAIVSPPDSQDNSDGEQPDHSAARRREVESTWNELQQAVRSIGIKRESSPVRGARTTVSSEPVTKVTSPSGLTAEARKILHSRSSTETALAIPGPTYTESSAHGSASEDEDSEDEVRGGKPPLLRKKSGELVKPALRPSSRRRYSSMPGTPTYNKSVHFNDDGNQTRHFLQVDKPSAISVDSSPVETYEDETEYPFTDNTSPRAEWGMKLANFPEDQLERKLQPVWVERIFLSADTKSLVGQVAVANISFHKTVVARFTLDYWKTTSEVSAEFSQEVRRQKAEDGYDRFNFTIRLSDQANLESKTLLLCVRYNVIGQEHWDNNNDCNYQVDFVKKTPTAVKKSVHLPQSTLGARPLSAIPRSRHSPPTSRGRTPSIDDDIVSRFDKDSAYHFGSSAQDLLGEDANTTIKLKPRTKRGSLFNSNPAQPGHGLGGRYDFGASLSAALTNAQDKLGKQSGLMASKGAAKADTGYFSKDAPSIDGDANDHKPDALATERPAMGSAQYKDLVSKFCYFTPATTGKLSPQPASTMNAGNKDGADDLDSGNLTGSSTPSPPGVSPMLDSTNENNGHGPFVQQSGSPAGMTRSVKGSRAASPVKFGYPYHRRDGYLSDSPTPTAIRG